LQAQKDVIEGIFTILSETGEAIEKGMRFKITDTQHTGDYLRFTVPLSGKVDDDSIAFVLLIGEDRLSGYGHELKPGSPYLGTAFTKKE